MIGKNGRRGNWGGNFGARACFYDPTWIDGFLLFASVRVRNASGSVCVLIGIVRDSLCRSRFEKLVPGVSRLFGVSTLCWDLLGYCPGGLIGFGSIREGIFN